LSERDGEDYHFVSDEEFDRLIESGGLLEHAETYGHRYGVPRQQVVDKLREGIDAYVRTDVQGAASIRRIEPDALLIFVAPPSIDELERRMRSRGDEDDANIARRLAAANAEMARQHEFDHIIINAPDALDDAANRLITVLEEERRKPRRYAGLLTG
jgi:guanylate kinase